VTRPDYDANARAGVTGTGLGPVGAQGTDGSAGGSVDAQNGNAIYAYRFVLPPGRDGLTPDLTLRYSSAGGNSWVGRGFSLDTPTIQRDTRNGVPTYGLEDRFVFSGMPLIPWENYPRLGMEYRMARGLRRPEDIHQRQFHRWKRCER
jgi:hypothetical protein